MIPLQTLLLVRDKEKANGKLLKNALSRGRYYNSSDLNVLRSAEAYYLPAVNADARIRWTTGCLCELYQLFNLGKNDEGPNEPTFLVTIADKSHITIDLAKHINFRAIRRKLGGALQGLNYIGMIEPGFFNAIYDKNGRIEKNIISWHGHFLVWGSSREELLQWKRRIAPRIEPIMPNMCAVHIKAIPPDQFGHRLWYINKSPCKEYSVGKRSKPSRRGLPRYKQNSRPLRPGHRVQLFHMLRNVTLPYLAMAGGNGREVMGKIKYQALRDYRKQNDI